VPSAFGDPQQKPPYHQALSRDLLTPCLRQLTSSLPCCSRKGEKRCWLGRAVRSEPFTFPVLVGGGMSCLCSKVRGFGVEQEVPEGATHWASPSDTALVGFFCLFFLSLFRALALSLSFS